ncbi:MAG: hypothetical protein QOK17_1927 [Sphingomonadales bacterium]|jgi:hypothetical protein|nr:hypothetical protein [Sphingomonadales bacterium]
MLLRHKILTLAAPLALLTLGGCAIGLPAQVSRFQAMPAPQGQSFVIQPADPADRGGLEFAQYADLVRRHLTALGYSEATSPQAATLVVSLDYGVDNGKQRVVSALPGFGRHAGFGFGYGRFWPHGGWGRGYSFGWDDPFYFDRDIDVQTIYTSFVDLDIKRAADGQSVFEGTAKARAATDNLRSLVPNLVDAMFVGFPGNSGEQLRITVPPPPRGPRG